MAGLNRKNWEDLNLSREDVENLTQAFKKEEFRKLLAEYAEEVTDPKNIKEYQDDIIKLEAERGVDCTFVNPEPGFVVKTSVDGKKKAFINICKNELIGRPSFKREMRENNSGLNWSIPYSQAPGREDHDKKRNRCIVYDVIFHPDTLYLAEKNSQFRDLVVDTALNAVEDSYNVNLDHKNIKFPNLKFKGLPCATVIRKRSEKPPVLTEEDIEFQKNIKYPYSAPPEGDVKPTIKNFENKKVVKEKYTTPKYIIKHRSSIDMQEYTYDKNAKINIAIPKDLVIEVNLPLLNSSNEVTLDVMEKSLHLICEKPCKYKLDIQLPYSVIEEEGNAKFDKDKRLLIITLPVLKSKMSINDLLREDSGVESDIGDRANSCDDASPVGSIKNEVDSDEGGENKIQMIESLVHNDNKTCSSDNENSKVTVGEEGEVSDDAYRTKDKVREFLDSDKHYSFPSYICNVDKNNMCFVVKVKNIDPESVMHKVLDASAFHVRFTSIGSGFFPMHYSFFVKFEVGCELENDLLIDTWNNNLTIQTSLKCANITATKYHVGLAENSLTEKYFDEPLQLAKILEDMKLQQKSDAEKSVSILSANVDEVVLSIEAIEPVEKPITEVKKKVNHQNSKDSDDSEISEISQSEDSEKINNVHARSISESSSDEIVSLSPITRKSILKKRICRSLSESNADDYQWGSSVEGTFIGGSDSCIPEEPEATEEIKDGKKTVRFSENILRQTFRANSSILGQRRKNQKRAAGKRRAMQRRLSEGENSEREDKDQDKAKEKEKGKGRKIKSKKTKAFIEELSKEETKGTKQCDGKEFVESEKKEDANSREETPLQESDDGKFIEFKSDLIFDIDM